LESCLDKIDRGLQLGRQILFNEKLPQRHEQRARVEVVNVEAFVQIVGILLGDIGDAQYVDSLFGHRCLREKRRDMTRSSKIVGIAKDSNPGAAKAKAQIRGNVMRPKSAAPSPPNTEPAARNFRDRVVELRRVPARSLKKNPKNWRLHPEEQRSALHGMLSDIGYAGAIIVRELPAGELEILDGHLREELSGDDVVPVLVVDLNDAETARFLATYDPLSGLAEIDAAALGALLDEVAPDLLDNADLRKMLADLHDELVVEEKEGAADEHEVPGLGLRPHEHYDYLVVLASTAQEWNVICERLGLVPEARRGRMGTSRAVHARKLLEVLGQ
jgi:hypothetical protein